MDSRRLVLGRLCRAIPTIDRAFSGFLLGLASLHRLQVIGNGTVVAIVDRLVCISQLDSSCEHLLLLFTVAISLRTHFDGLQCCVAAAGVDGVEVAHHLVLLSRHGSGLERVPHREQHARRVVVNQAHSVDLGAIGSLTAAVA